MRAAFELTGDEVANAGEIERIGEAQHRELGLQPRADVREQYGHLLLELRPFLLDHHQHQQDHDGQGEGEQQHHQQGGEAARHAAPDHPRHARLQDVGEDRAEQERREHRTEQPEQDAEAQRDGDPDEGLALIRRKN